VLTLLSDAAEERPVLCGVKAHLDTVTARGRPGHREVNRRAPAADIEVFTTTTTFASM
jgi:hypothetical protein